MFESCAGADWANPITNPLKHGPFTASGVSCEDCNADIFTACREKNADGIFNETIEGEIIAEEITPNTSALFSKFKHQGSASNEVISSPELSSGHPKVSEEEPGSIINNEYGINGLIDETVMQGETGDCWLIAGVKALCRTEKGRQIIKNSIIPNKDGSVTVKFAGAGKSYTLTKEEIDAGSKSDLFSKGDKDMLVIELAAKKLFAEKLLNDENEIQGFKMAAKKSGESLEEIMRQAAEYSLDGGFETELWKAVTPNYNIKNFKGAHLEKQIDEILNDMLKNNKNTAAGFALGGLGIEHCAALTGGNGDFQYCGAPHAFTIEDVSENTVTFSEPRNTDVKYIMTWEEFKKLSPREIFSIDLTEA